MPKKEHHKLHMNSENNPNIGCKRTEKSKKKMSDIRKEKFKNGELNQNGINNPMFGKHHSEETRNKISNNHPNKITDQKLIDNIEIDIKNKNLTQIKIAKKYN